MGAKAFHDLRADPLHRIQAACGVLKDHRDVAALPGAKLAWGQGQKVMPIKPHLPRGTQGRAVQQPHDRQRHRAFARPAFADDPKALPGVDRKGQVVHNPGVCGRPLQAHAQRLHIKDGP